MSCDRIRIVAPSRLHFGLLCPAGGPHLGGQPRFGGVGAMIDSPGLELRLARDERFSATGPLSQRVADFAKAWAIHHKLDSLPPWRIEVVRAPPEHVGLGVGTQLGLAVAAGLTLASGWPLPAPAKLAQCVNRGARSAVGAHGFALGGLIIDAGKTDAGGIAPLAQRIALPHEWRFLLLRPPGDQGLSGGMEKQVFAEMPPGSRATTGELRTILYERLAPAAAAQRFEPFADALYAYGKLAGSCFAASQKGPYNGPHVTRAVEVLRELGVRGVGQSSWGPTVFALFPNQASAEAARCTAGERFALAELTIAAPNNTGALISTDGPGGQQSVTFAGGSY
jgi:beta-RFAP synthase